MDEKHYIAIDLKSFYASVECAERGLDPLDTNLLVADESRTDKTICLAVSPALKAYGLPGRIRLFEAKQRIREANAMRLAKAPGRKFTGKSTSAKELAENPALELDFIIAPPRMAYYMVYSRRIVEIYLRHVSFEDLLVYSIDEVFIDATGYLKRLKLTPREFAMKLIHEVLAETNITATAGIGTNLYLAKIAMDIVAKHIPADKNGVRIAELDERGYREQLWSHRPLTDFWRIGRGTARKLEAKGMYTMGDVARCSIGKDSDTYNEELLYKLFGVNAELIIDHAWGWEPAEIRDCKAYRPENKSLCSGQVLPRPYTHAEGRLIVCEMADLLSLDLVRKGLVTDQLVLDVGYDTENVSANYTGEIKINHYGKAVPKPAHGSIQLGGYTASTNRILAAIGSLYDRITNPNLTIRRVSITTAHLLPEEDAAAQEQQEQLSLFDEPSRQEPQNDDAKEKQLQLALINIKDRYGATAIVKGMNMKKGATAIERSRTVGGHKA